MKSKKILFLLIFSLIITVDVHLGTDLSGNSLKDNTDATEKQKIPITYNKVKPYIGNHKE